MKVGKLCKYEDEDVPEKALRLSLFQLCQLYQVKWDEETLEMGTFLNPHVTYLSPTMTDSTPRYTVTNGSVTG